jgi:hypothetical protein
MAEKVAKEVKASISAGSLLEQYDLGGFDEAKCAALVSSAFTEPQIITGAMPKITFVIGGGKLSRQKYHADLGKYFATALRDIGYKEDAGGSAVFVVLGNPESVPNPTNDRSLACIPSAEVGFTHSQTCACLLDYWAYLGRPGIQLPHREYRVQAPPGRTSSSTARAKTHGRCSSERDPNCRLLCLRDCF